VEDGCLISRKTGKIVATPLQVYEGIQKAPSLHHLGGHTSNLNDIANYLTHTLHYQFPRHWILSFFRQVPTCHLPLFPSSPLPVETPRATAPHVSTDPPLPVETPPQGLGFLPGCYWGGRLLDNT
jgi:hypothetical protein